MLDRRGINFYFFAVNKIKQNREVTINIPDETHGSAIIRVEGNKQGVEEAKAVSLNKFLANITQDITRNRLPTCSSVWYIKTCIYT